MGVACAPGQFTKIMRVVFSHLRELGYISSGYLDEFFLLGKSKLICLNNVADTTILLTDLGFIVSVKKSITILVQVLMPEKHEQLSVWRRTC